MACLCLCLLFQLGCRDRQRAFTIWIGGAPQELDFWEDLIEAFGKKTGHSLRLVRQPTYSDQRRQMLLVSLASKQPDPDLFLMDVVWVNQFARSGWLEPLDALAGETGVDTGDFFPNILESVDRLQGALYALPVFHDVGLLYYRTDLLAKYAISRPPETWSELLEQACLVQKGERGQSRGFNGFVRQGAQYEGLVCTFVEFAVSHGGRIMHQGAIDMEYPGNAQGLAFMRDLIHRDKVSPRNTYTDMREEEVRRAFQRRDALFERNWSYAWALHQSDGSPVKGKVGLTVLPHARGRPSAAALGGWHIGLSRYSDRKPLAWDFIKFVTSYEVQKKMVLTIGWNPARRDIYQDEAVLTGGSPGWNREVAEDDLLIGLRADDVHVGPVGEHRLQARVALVAPSGTEGILYLRLQDRDLLARMPRHGSFEEGQLVGLDFDQRRMLIFDQDGNRLRAQARA